MKVAMITPYYKESTAQLRRCHNSVIKQTHKDVTHIMVADGNPHPWCDKQEMQHIILPRSHSDAGATPRALAAISAFSQGYDAVGFIDADNWIDTDHVAEMVRCIDATKAAAVVATRRIHALDNTEMYVDLVESNGENMVDTNCMFLTNAAVHLMSYWVTAPGMRLWSDRAFWDVVKQSKIPVARCTRPTVAYLSKWAWHYQYAGLTPPPDSVWIDKDAAGNLIHVKHKDRK
jgi:glycosyltransferase involved in cell wall biosynthesis